MNPYRSVMDNNAAKQPDVPVNTRGDGTQPLENQYNKLLSEYTSFAATHTTAQDAAYMQHLTSTLQQSGVLPSLSLVWGEQKTSQGATFTGDELNKYASGQVGNAFDQAMGESLQSQFDQLKTSPVGDIFGLNQNISRDTLQNAVAKVDQQAIASSIAQMNTPGDTSCQNGYSSYYDTVTHYKHNNSNNNDQSVAPYNPDAPRPPFDPSLPHLNQPYDVNNKSCALPADTKTAGSNDGSQTGSCVNPFDKKIPMPLEPANRYTVQKGDSLWSIAADLLKVPNDKGHAHAIYQMTQTLEALNPHLNPRRIQIGDTLELGDLMQPKTAA